VEKLAVGLKGKHIQHPFPKVGRHVGFVNFVNNESLERLPKGPWALGQCFYTA